MASTLLTTNGAFSDDGAGWTFNAPDGSFANGKAIASTGNSMTLYQTIGPRPAGKTLWVSLKVDQINGNITVNACAAAGQTITTPGVHNLIFVSNGSNSLASITKSAPVSYTIDQFTVREISMALASVGFELHVQLVDSGGRTANLAFKMDSADYATLATDAATVLNRIAAVTDAVVKGYTLVTRFEENALTLPSTAQIEMRATVIGQLSSNPLKKVTVQIPAPVDGLFVGAPGSGENYDIVDGADSDLLAYLSTWQAPSAIANISDGEYLDATAPFVRGKRTHRQASIG